MKAVNVTFEDEEIKRLEEVKGDKSWHDFILELAGGRAKRPQRPQRRSLA